VSAGTGKMSFPEFVAFLGQNPITLVLFIAIFVVEITLLAVALIDWVRRPPEQMVGNRYLWLVLIIFVNMIGPILYLVIARKKPPAADSAEGPPSGESASKAVDVLYGDGDETEPR
jgi:hypothetical protein